MSALRRAMNTYSPLSESSWQALTHACRPQRFGKGDHLVAVGDVPRHFGFLFSGLVRAYAISPEGAEYTKIFFTEGMMPGTMAALLTGEPSKLALQALEDCRLIEIDHAQYRQLLSEHRDLLMYHCRYLEVNWILAKVPRELALAQQTATHRYEALMSEQPDLVQRLSQGQIASYLGVTPTQLSRLRRTYR